jgi:hypothetical protein
MHITCHCDWHGDIEVDDALVARANELRAQGAGRRERKSPWQRFLKSLANWWQRTVRHRHQ